MKEIIGYVSLTGGIITFLLSIHFLILSIGFRKSNLHITNGYLKGKKHFTNYYSGGKSGRIYKDWVEFGYAYTVDNKDYFVHHGIPGKPNNLKNTVKIAYQKNNPKYSYISGLTIPIQPILASLIFIVSIMLIFSGVFLI